MAQIGLHFITVIRRTIGHYIANLGKAQPREVSFL